MSGFHYTRAEIDKIESKALDAISALGNTDMIYLTNMYNSERTVLLINFELKTDLYRYHCHLRHEYYIDELSNESTTKLYIYHKEMLIELIEGSIEHCMNYLYAKQ